MRGRQLPNKNKLLKGWYFKMTKKKCNDNCACSHVDGKQAAQDVNYGYYSRVLKEPFDTLTELAEAEEAYYAKLKAKEDAKRIEAQGLAEAAAAKAKVAAGLTPLEKATIEKETAIGIAQALANSKVRWVPEIIVSGDGGNGNNAMDAVGLNMMMDIVKKMNSEKK